MHPKQIEIEDFNYQLPTDKIAKFPLEERDKSKLLIYKGGKIEEDIYRNVALYLPANSLLVFNNSRVIHARILFTKASGGLIELFCLKPAEPQSDYSTGLSTTSAVQWKCMIGGASKWKGGDLRKVFRIKGKQVELLARLKEKSTDAYITEFRWDPSHYTFAEVLEGAGEVPLPPYIKRQAAPLDNERYQTIYALHNGSVAAPTAGLHFTGEIFSSLHNKKIKCDFVTLHVGAGTFKPVKAPSLVDHEMHAELMEVTLTTISGIIDHLEKDVIAVGTTSLRVLESLYWMGVKASLKPGCKEEELVIKQWDAYETSLSGSALDVTASLQSLVGWMRLNGREKLLVNTQILIAPGYVFKVAKALLTNFHQPRSTLLLLIAAAAGTGWRKIYDHALQNNFRFLSYGDGCLIFF